MGNIDEKVHALEFTTTTTKSRGEVRQLLDDAVQVAQGEKITLSDSSDDLVKGVARNFVRMQHAAFTFAFKADTGGKTSVTFRIPDYLRTRETLLYFIPISPWSAPAYKTLKEFSEYVRKGL
jgi:hypothetical protein